MDYFFKKYHNKWYVRDVAFERFEREDVMSIHEESKSETVQVEVAV